MSNYSVFEFVGERGEIHFVYCHSRRMVGTVRVGNKKTRSQALLEKPNHELMIALGPPLHLINGKKTDALGT
jgi:hypothetical protein